MYHSYFNGVRIDVVKNHLQLIAYSFRRYIVYSTYTLRILNGQSGQYVHGITAQRRNRFRVGLYSGPSTTVKASDAEDGGNAIISFLFHAITVFLTSG